MEFVVVDGIRYSPDYKVCYGGDNCRITEANILEGCEEISNFAFRYFNNLTKIILPSTLKKLGDYCFQGCMSLEFLEIPDGIEIIPKGMVSECTNLKKLILPDSITEVKRFAFYRCKSLEKLVFYPKIKSLPASSIAECENLHVWSDLLSIGYTKDDPIEGYEILCTFEKYLEKDLYDFIKSLKDDLFGVLNDEEITKVIEEEVYNLSFI